MDGFESTRRCRDRVLETIRTESIASAMRDLLAARAGQRYTSAIGRLGNDAFHVALIGRQGIGKSTLANALIGRRILPIDETETTNVVCHLRSCGEEPERTVVEYVDGRVEHGPAEGDFVGAFTDEQRNPGNHKAVKQVTCYVQSPVLESGITLVDTPGIGSLTRHTGAATEEYLPQISLGLFLLSTTPTLLESEHRFLQATWAVSQSFIFVQNVWGQNEAQISDAVQDNLSKLRRIALEEQQDDHIVLKTLDVHEALEGIANERPDAVRRSGLEELRHELSARLGRGAAAAHLAINGEAILNGLRAGLVAATARLQALSDGERVSQEEFRRQHHAAFESLDQIGRRWSEARAAFRTGQHALVDKFVEDLEARVGAVEDHCIEMVEARRAGAETVSRVLGDGLTQAATAANNALQRDYEKLVATFLADAGSLLQQTEQATLDVATLGSLPSDLRWTERLEKVGRGFVGVGGIALGSCAFLTGAALVAGKGLVVALAIVPGIGWAIAGAVLLGGLGLREWHRRRAVAALVREVHGAVRTTRRAVTKATRHQFEEHAIGVDAGLDGDLRSSMEQQRRVLDQMDQDRHRQETDKAATRHGLEAAVEVLEAALQEVSGLLIRANAGGGG